MQFPSLFIDNCAEALVYTSPADVMLQWCKSTATVTLFSLILFYIADNEFCFCFKNSGQLQYHKYFSRCTLRCLHIKFLNNNDFMWNKV